MDDIGQVRDGMPLFHHQSLSTTDLMGHTSSGRESGGQSGSSPSHHVQGPVGGLMRGTSVGAALGSADPTALSSSAHAPQTRLRSHRTTGGFGTRSGRNRNFLGMSASSHGHTGLNGNNHNKVAARPLEGTYEGTYREPIQRPYRPAVKPSGGAVPKPTSPTTRRQSTGSVPATNSTAVQQTGLQRRNTAAGVAPVRRVTISPEIVDLQSTPSSPGTNNNSNNTSPSNNGFARRNRGSQHVTEAHVAPACSSNMRVNFAQSRNECATDSGNILSEDFNPTGPSPVSSGSSRDFGEDLRGQSMPNVGHNYFNRDHNVTRSPNSRSRIRSWDELQQEMATNDIDAILKLSEAESKLKSYEAEQDNAVELAMRLSKHENLDEDCQMALAMRASIQEQKDKDEEKELELALQLSKVQTSQCPSDVLRHDEDAEMELALQLSKQEQSQEDRELEMALRLSAKKAEVAKKTVENNSNLDEEEEMMRRVLEMSRRESEHEEALRKSIREEQDRRKSKGSYDDISSVTEMVKRTDIKDEDLHDIIADISQSNTDGDLDFISRQKLALERISSSRHMDVISNHENNEEFNHDDELNYDHNEDGDDIEEFAREDNHVYDEKYITSRHEISEESQHDQSIDKGVKGSEEPPSELNCSNNIDSFLNNDLPLEQNCNNNIDSFLNNSDNDGEDDSRTCTGITVGSEDTAPLAPSLDVGNELVSQGQAETRQAMKDGLSHIITCQGCKCRLHAPTAYKLVFCPNCKTVSQAKI